MRLFFLHAWEVVVDTSILRPMADSCCPDPGVGHYNDAGHPDNEPRWYDVLKRHQTSKMCHSGPKQGQWTCRETTFRLVFAQIFHDNPLWGVDLRLDTLLGNIVTAAPYTDPKLILAGFRQRSSKGTTAPCLRPRSAQMTGSGRVWEIRT